MTQSIAARLAAALTAPAAIVAPDGAMLAANTDFAAFARLWRGLEGAGEPDLAPLVGLIDWAALRRDGKVTRHDWLATPRGDDVYICCEASLLDGWADMGAEHVALAVFQDQTERIEREGQLRQAQALRMGALSAALDGVVGLTAAGQIMEMNPEAQKILGWSEAEATGRDFAEVALPPELQAEWRDGLLDRLQNGAPWLVGRRVEGVCRRHDGECFPAELAVSEVALPGRRAFFVFLRDISDRKAAQHAIEHLAYFDVATGLANRVMIEQSLDRLAIERAPSLLVVQLDRFELIRGGLAPDVTERLLRAAADRVVAAAAEAQLIARVADHRFAAMFDRDPDAEGLLLSAQYLRAAFQPPFLLDGREIYIPVSVGAIIGALGPDQGPPTLRDAEIAADYAQRRGVGVLLFDAAMREAIEEQRLLESDLRYALEFEPEQLRLVYQPIVRVADASLAGFEALIRWRHPSRGEVSPGRFVPLAEATGLSRGLGEFVLETACRQIAGWRRYFERARPPFVAINLSADQFESSQLPERVLRALRDQELPPGVLKLEITESAVMANAESAVKVLERLRRLGLGLAIDDFGTGYSSLAYLQRFPVERLKIDQSFVRRMGDREEDLRLVGVVIDMARLYKFGVVAEGVETEAEHNMLQGLGCDYAQGYYFSRPLEAVKAEEWLRAHFGGPTEAPEDDDFFASA